MSAYKISRATSEFALFEFLEESKSNGIFVDIAISSFNSLFSAINLSGSILVDKSIFHIFQVTKRVL
ncbi:MAG: hypothetical protein EOM78_20895 [Erysipelotrichia bacterium]|nr:hypothetical protein [Erysipelotrichia bacterium]